MPMKLFELELEFETDIEVGRENGRGWIEQSKQERGEVGRKYGKIKTEFGGKEKRVFVWEMLKFADDTQCCPTKQNEGECVK